jgi:hypothetical protein
MKSYVIGYGIASAFLCGPGLLGFVAGVLRWPRVLAPAVASVPALIVLAFIVGYGSRRMGRVTTSVGTRMRSLDTSLASRCSGGHSPPDPRTFSISLVTFWSTAMAKARSAPSS